MDPNPSQADLDGDKMGDVCDLDDDNDGWPDEGDNCRVLANGPGLGTCTEGITGTCMIDEDCDTGPGSGDGVCDVGNADADQDGVGSACDLCPNENATGLDENQDGRIDRRGALDIRPGGCPNPLNRNNHGVLPVALIGSNGIGKNGILTFDVRDVDVDSVRLSRVDHVGGSVAPHEGPPGPHSTFEDMATPLVGAPCECHDLGGDGVEDLLLKFETDELVAALELDALPPGSQVELVVSGKLMDGTPFAATDCVILVPASSPHDNLVVKSTALGAWFDVSPPDLREDDGGFTNHAFARA